MKLSYFHVASDVPKNITPESAVVIDVLRATTTIAWALNNGADSVQAFADIDDLKSAAMSWPASERVLLGERGGQRIKGFDLGNSPLGVSEELVKGKRLFMSTTNGTKALHKVRMAKSLFTMALANRQAVAERLLTESPGHVWILGSGWEGSYSLEDSLAAGALASFLMRGSDVHEAGNDEIMAAVALWEYWENDIERCLRIATHGQRLAGIGNHDDDFACCATLDNLSIVPKQNEIGIIRAS